MKLIQKSGSFNGVKLPLIQAEEARLRLIKAGILLKSKKILNNHEFVFFPISDSVSASDVLGGLEYQLVYHIFPEEHLKPSVLDSLKKNFPNEPWDNISIKFDQIGGIGLLRLDDEMTSRELRTSAGSAIINAYPKITTVMNKLDVTEGIERIFPIEFLAGEEKYESWHKEYGVLIKVDLRRAYFNPRLAEEHRRLALEISRGNRILDLFTGVGPFALHCAKVQNCEVIAVDINPYAIKSLKASIKRNKLKGLIIPLVGDAGEIFRAKRYFDRIIINLPNLSINYLEYTSKLIKDGGIITFYQFMEKIEQPEQFLSSIISEKLMNVCNHEILNIRVGREVSPSKIQLNVDLRISSV
ncbi:MAG: class I SAM-dependent methyltransferase [Candidatus Hodarchaeales archaeon]|jgi:tRNA (guanine37-N1)-methyltransferase